MAISTEDILEIQLLIVREIGELVNATSLQEARKTLDKRRRFIEAERLDFRGEHEAADRMRRMDSEF